MPRTIIVCGAPGSGKTTHAKRTATGRNATLLDIDTVTERLVSTGLMESGHSLVEVHNVHCHPDFRRQRLAGRGDARDLAKLEDWDQYVGYYGDEHPPVFEHVPVDGTRAE